jgi:6-phosphofructokinase 1
MSHTPLKRIGVLNGGGDCAGLNAVITAIVRSATALNYECVGILKGWEGILDPCMLSPLGLEQVRGISHLGGTILRTTNHGRFAAKAGEGGVSRIPEDVLRMVERNMRAHAIDALIVIGGDGTLSGALQVMELTGIPVIGVPKTIDNDLDGTDRTFGFASAVEVVREALDRIHTTAASHDRVIFVETMGRHTGWIALYGGVAGNADAILLPEVPVDVPALTRFLQQRDANQSRASLVVVAEGARIGGNLAVKKASASAETQLGGAAERLMAAVEAESPNTFEMRSVVLGHTQRGGSPTAEDRILSRRYGVAAIDALHARQFGHMVCLRKGEMTTVPIAEAVGALKRVTVNDPVFDAARKTGVFVGA